MEFPYTVDSQAAFDELVKDRITRERSKFADYDELKTKAAQVDAVKAEAEKALAEAVARAEQAESRVSEFETKSQVEAWRTEVATAAGIPADVLRGSTKEEFEAHAATLKPLLTAQRAPVIPNQGDEPTTPGATDATAAVRSLFGNAGD